MKEPKFPKLEDLPKDNKYDFFAEGIFPEEIEEKQRLNKNRSTRKQNRFPLSIPPESRKPANTQKEDDELLPFFAKNYPPSSESKEDICFINSPAPSDTPDNTGEAEEVDVDEEEDEESENGNNNKKKKEKNSNINNEDIGASVEFNSELEYEYEHPSKMMTKEEVREMIRKNQERRREEKRKKEEEEKRKEEENRKKEEEKKKKEEENKRKEEEKKRKDEEKKRKEKEEKEKEKERLKKLEEEEKKKKMKSSKKDPINALSSIKKNYDDNSNIASNSMINDMQNIFPIQEEKGENEEDEDDTKKNFRKSSKEKYSEKKSKSKSKNSKKISDFDQDIEKNKNKKNPKTSADEDEETKETDLNKKSKNDKNSRKSNGLKKEDKKEKIKSNERIDEEENEEDEFSNYGDELADTSSKKEKVPQKRSKRFKKRTQVKKFNANDEISDVTLYNAFSNVKTRDYEYQNQDENMTFGETRKYSLRHRLPALRHDLGERAFYFYDKNGLCTLKGAKLAETNTLSHILDKKIKNNRKKLEKKKKKLVKDLNKNIDTIPEEESEFNSELLDSENISEFGDDDARILKIPKGGKKSRAKNFDTVLVIKIIEANGKNMIKVDKKEYKNLKSDNEVKVGKNQEFEILNFSNNNLVVQLLFDDNN